MTKKPDYQSLQAELDEILDQMQNEDTDVDTSVKNYERGLKIIAELEKYLSDAENTVKELKAKFNS